ncbi:GPO family capsid scaffolding protein [Novosphingobium sp. 9]|uniref:GPO family capsid scaffolding protein n=1 Tax=Novosphingobium sp. 9 TaxID=2025349 RepID=UPI0021B5C6A9|nr:GPO family capsid scaffolding protein [Novosphingobium sp. 9]
MKTKSFLLATSGSTVDGRTIDDKMLTEMANSYDPKTYGARLNIEHIRGSTGQAPFRAFGDVESVETREVDVNFNGKTEKRLGLFGTFDVNDDAKALNQAGQKVYPSIEIEPNFAGKGYAYLMGVALTDSPASIATDRLEFNRHLPGTIALSRDEAALLEFADDTAETEGGKALLSSMRTMFDNFSAKFAKTNSAPETKQEIKVDAPVGFDFAKLEHLLEEMAKGFAAAIDTMRQEFHTEVDALGVKFAKLEREQEDTPDRNFTRRPQSNGNAGNYAGIF